MWKKYVQLMATVVVLVTFAAACGGQSTPTQASLPKAWAAADVRDVRRLADQSDPQSEQCANFSVIPPQAFGAQQQKFGWRAVPTALGDCDRGDEIVEYATFRSNRDRDAFIEERTSVLCRRAAAVAAPVPPFAWVRGKAGSAWTAQADSKASATAIAKRLDGEVDVRRCNLKNTLGWRRSGVDQVRGLAFEVSSAQIRCAGFSLVDRAALRPSRADAAVPSAVGSCTTSDAAATDPTAQRPPMVFAAFDERSQTRAAFVRDALGSSCTPGTTAIQGDDWAVVAPSEFAPQVAATLGGTAVGSCG